MRRLLLAAYIANALLLITSLLILPDNVASHFSRGGRPDSWMSKEANALVFLLIETPLFFIFYYAGGIPFSVSPRYLNIPNKDYWLRAENRAHLRHIMQRYAAGFGVVLFSFLFVTAALAIEANRGDPVRFNEEVFLWVFGAFMVYTVVWVVKFTLALRSPK